MAFSFKKTTKKTSGTMLMLKQPKEINNQFELNYTAVCSVLFAGIFSVVGSASFRSAGLVINSTRIDGKWEN